MVEPYGYWVHITVWDGCESSLLSKSGRGENINSVGCWCWCWCWCWGVDLSSLDGHRESKQQSITHVLHINVPHVYSTYMYQINCTIHVLVHIPYVLQIRKCPYTTWHAHQFLIMQWWTTWQVCQTLHIIYARGSLYWQQRVTTASLRASLHHLLSKPHVNYPSFPPPSSGNYPYILHVYSTYTFPSSSKIKMNGTVSSKCGTFTSKRSRQYRPLKILNTWWIHCSINPCRTNSPIPINFCYVF